MSALAGVSGAAICYMEGHNWGREGGGVCINCDARLRCSCGQFIREDGLDAHMARCRHAPPCSGCGLDGCEFCDPADGREP